MAGAGAAEHGVWRRRIQKKSKLPQFKGEPTIEGLIATGFGDYIIARYTIDVGKEKGTGVRLSVFRKSGNSWLVVAHANLGGRVH